MIKKKEKLPAERYFNKDGLTLFQVQSRKEQKLVNTKEVKTSKSYLSIIIKNVFTLFNMLWFAIAFILIYIGAYEELFFMIIIILNLLIGIIQEIKAKLTVEKLSLLTAPVATVKREGKEYNIPVTSVVLDDIIKLNMGKEICCDSIIVSGNVEVNESMLTGESVPVKKTEGDNLFAGSFVTSGSCTARVDKVGSENYVQKLAKKAKKLKEPKSELLKSLRLLINIIAILILPLTAITVYRNYNIFDGVIYRTITKSAGAVVGMIPSGMFLLTSVALAVGVVRLAKKRTLVQDLYCIEMLARTTTLCLDKTGTITDGTMDVVKEITLNQDKTALKDIVSSILYATKDENHTALALINKYSKNEILKAEKAYPFSSARKYSAIYLNGKTYVLGAAEYIFSDLDKKTKDIIYKYSQSGYRVLSIGYCDKEIENNVLPNDVKPLYLILLEDHIRDNAPKTIEWFNKNNVKIKIISGDNPVSVAEIAKKAGVINADKYISVENMTEAEIIEAVKEYTVFGRVTPEQKAYLIKALKQNKEVTAMTGDGVNDILAMKESDCSIAMAAGTEAARNVANLVLLDSDFSRMPEVVAEGRRVINNITKTSSMFLMKTFFVIFLVVIFAFFPVAKYPYSYPFSPKQMMLLEILVIGMPSFFIALQPNINLIKGRFLSSVFKKCIPAAVILTLSTVVLYNFGQFFGELFGTNYNDIVTMAMLTVTFTGFEMLGITCYKFNLYRGIMFIAFVVISTMLLIFMPKFFEMGYLSNYEFLFVAIQLILNLPLLVLFLKLAEKIKIKKVKI